MGGVRCGRCTDGLTILIVGDNAHAVESLIEALRSAGAGVIAVRTARLALAYTERHPVDFILIDLAEPSWWSTAEFRALRALNESPIYALREAGAQPIDAAARVTGVFAKPISVDAVVAALASLPRRRR